MSTITFIFVCIGVATVVAGFMRLVDKMEGHR